MQTERTEPPERNIVSFQAGIRVAAMLDTYRRMGGVVSRACNEALEIYLPVAMEKLMQARNQEWQEISSEVDLWVNSVKNRVDPKTGLETPSPPPKSPPSSAGKASYGIPKLRRGTPPPKVLGASALAPRRRPQLWDESQKTPGPAEGSPEHHNGAATPPENSQTEAPPSEHRGKAPGA